MRGHSAVLLGVAVVLVIFFLNSHTLSTAYSDVVDVRISTRTHKAPPPEPDTENASAAEEQDRSSSGSKDVFGQLSVPAMEPADQSSCPRYAGSIPPQFGETLELSPVTREAVILQRNNIGAPPNERFGGTVNGKLYKLTEVDEDRLKRHGYNPSEVRSQLYLSNPDDPQIKEFGDKLEELDAALIKYTTLKRRRNRFRTALTKVGPTGRSWGIASAKTNKWRFYHKHMAELQRKLNTKIKICEVGMLAGHSTTLFNIFLNGAEGVESHVVFDLKQPRTPWWKPVSNFLKEKYPYVKITWGMSQDTVPSYRHTYPSSECQYISLDGSKVFPVFNSDMYHFRKMVTGEHIILLDDVNPCLVRKGDPRFATEEEIASIIALYSSRYPEDINSIISYHLARRELILEECFDIDIPGIPFYGNCALRFNLSTTMTLPTHVENQIKK